MSQPKEPIWITFLRHAVLLVFVALSVYPVLNVLSISLRPGNQLRSTDLAIIPDGWTFDSYVQLFTEQPFLQWLGTRYWFHWRSQRWESVWLRRAVTHSAAFDLSVAAQACWRF